MGELLPLMLQVYHIVEPNPRSPLWDSLLNTWLRDIRLMTEITVKQVVFKKYLCLISRYIYAICVLFFMNAEFWQYLT